MTFKEKLAKDYPIYVIERLKEGCYGCPSSYGYEPTQPKYFCQNTSCGICWNRIIPGTDPRDQDAPTAGNGYKDAIMSRDDWERDIKLTQRLKMMIQY